ncbi:hypothetical protein [Paraburkholderia hospita]|nr:hypothetical protein [Paraburkholderia hospita]
MAASIDGTLFKEIMAEMREHTHKRLTNLPAAGESEEENHLGDYVPSQRLHEGYSRLRSVPLTVSNDDQLDDAIQQIKATGNSGARTAANNSQSGITNALNTYRGDRDDDEFRSKMESISNRAQDDFRKAIDATYDKAQQVAQSLSPSQQNAVISLLVNLESALQAIWNNIFSLIKDAVRDIGKYIQGAPSNIDDLFAKIAAYIKSVF